MVTETRKKKVQERKNARQSELVEYRKNYRKENHARLRKQQMEWRQANPEKYLAQRQRARHNSILKEYGVTKEQYDAIFESQDRKCAICQKELQDPRKVHLDHCHQSGRIRGILCSKCNLGLGHFGDSLALVERAVEYLKGIVRV